MTKIKIAIVVGSNRRESINRKLAQAIVKLADGRIIPKFVQIDDLPMYNQDHECASARATDPASARARSSPQGMNSFKAC